MALTTLIELLYRLDEAHLDLIALAGRKKQAIIENKVDDLVQILNKESRQVKIVEKLEEERIQAAYAFLHQVGIRSNLNLNLTELSRLVFDLDEKQRLLEAQQKLSSTLQQLRNANSFNQELLNQALSYIDFSIETMAYPSDDQVTYKHPAARTGGFQKSGFFDSRG